MIDIQKKGALFVLVPLLILGLSVTACENTEELVDPSSTTGMVVIDISPDDIDAPWELILPDGSTIGGNGDAALRDLVPGSYQLNFGTVPGYGSPTPHSQTLEAGDELRLTGTYVARSAPTGSVDINPDPDEIGADWFLTVDGKLAARGSGDSTLTDVSTGEIQLIWNPVQEWAAPQPNPSIQALFEDSLITFAGTYTPLPDGDLGWIVVRPLPEGIEAPWTLSGPQAAGGVGEFQLPGVPVGDYTIEWGEVFGYKTPKPSAGTLTDQEILEFETVYEPATGTITIDPTPNDINAPWTVTGPEGFFEQGNGDASLTGIPTGSYTISFGALSGWNSPQPSTYTRSLQDGAVEICAGIYTEIGDPSPGSPSVSTVSDVLSNGARATITGSGFGFHTLQLSSGAGPNGWIEANPAGTDFNQLSGAPGWDVGMSSDSAPPALTSERAYSGRHSAVARIDGTAYSNWQSVMRYHRPDSFTSIYVSFLVYWEPLSASPYRHTQWKMWRINDTGTVVDRTGQFLSTSRYNGSNGDYHEYQAGFFCVLDCTSYAWDYCMENMRPEPYYPPADNQIANYRYLNRGRSIPWSTSMPTPRQWDRVELYIQRSDMDASNGVAEYWITKPNASRFKIDRLEGIRSLSSATDCRNVSEPWEYFQFQNYFDDDGSWDAPVFTAERANFFYDDIYLQFGTQARVEMGDRETYDACTRLAVQTPVRWTEDSIEIDLNHGPFGTGSTVYLFVVSEDGEASPGYPVVLQ